MPKGIYDRSNTRTSFNALTTQNSVLMAKLAALRANFKMLTEARNTLAASDNLDKTILDQVDQEIKATLHLIDRFQEQLTITQAALGNGGKDNNEPQTVTRASVNVTASTEPKRKRGRPTRIQQLERVLVDAQQELKELRGG